MLLCEYTVKPYPQHVPSFLALSSPCTLSIDLLSFYKVPHPREGHAAHGCSVNCHTAEDTNSDRLRKSSRDLQCDPLALVWIPSLLTSSRFFLHSLFSVDVSCKLFLILGHEKDFCDVYNLTENKRIFL